MRLIWRPGKPALLCAPNVEKKTIQQRDIFVSNDMHRGASSRDHIVSEFQYCPLATGPLRLLYSNLLSLNVPMSRKGIPIASSACRAA